MEETWTKRSPKGRTVTYTSRGEPQSGFVHTVQIEGIDVIETTNSLQHWPRQQVEEHFAHFVLRN